MQQDRQALVNANSMHDITQLWGFVHYGKRKKEVKKEM